MAANDSNRSTTQAAGPALLTARPRTWWRKLTWTWAPASSYEAGDAIVRNLWLHWFPVKVHRSSISFRYSLWLGTISAVLFAILVVTGVILMFVYVPSVERAYWSVKDIEYVVPFGRFLRALHRMAAHLMVAVVFLHMIRVFLTGAFKNTFTGLQNRPLNWLIGIVLLLVTLLLSFTGYLLPWDQLAFWAITVGTNIARAAPLIGEQIRYLLIGGYEIGQNALIRFYVLHCVLLPALLTVLFAWHMWRIRKDGGLACVDRSVLEARRRTVTQSSKTWALLGVTTGRTVHVEASEPEEETQVLPSSPALTRRLLLVSVVVSIVCAALAIAVGAPLEEPANPAETPNPAKAPWYFLWLQELVADTTVHLGPFTINGAVVGGILIPGLLVLAAALWPYRDRSPVHTVGVWWPRGRLRQNLVFLLAVLFIVVLTIVGTFMRGPNWEFFWPWESWPPAPKLF